MIVVAAFLFLINQLSAVADEDYRIRIENIPAGLVQVSLDQGRTYWTIGRVTRPANAHIIGFAAASYVSAGSVAAIATHGIRIKTGQLALGMGKTQIPLIFSIVPRQFAKLPAGYGGHVPRSAAILTDIDAGHSIFRNQSPYVGSPVYLQRRAGLEPLPENYTPQVGDVLVITVEHPKDPPRWIEFENKRNGKVTAHFAEGQSADIARVIRPVKGVGRYDGTTYTGTGAVNTNHPGVITVSTAPLMPPETQEGGLAETRGGFMVQPSRHAREQGESSPQVMIVAPIDESSGRLEGCPPLFRGYINLYRYVDKPQHSYRVQIRIDDGDWEDLPAFTGKVDDAFGPRVMQDYFAKSGRSIVVKSGVTAVRILFPDYDQRALQLDLAKEAHAYSAKAVSQAGKRVSGVVSIGPTKFRKKVCIVNLYVDGRLTSTINEWPYRFSWDSRSVPNGWHSIEFEQVCDSDRIMTERTIVLVSN